MIVKGSGFVRGNRPAAQERLIAHLKYTEHRAKDVEHESRDDRRIFSKDVDVVSRRDAVDDVMSHTSTSVNYHKLILSPGEDEPIADWREWTREVMRDLEERQGKELHWYAVKHDNTDNPHVHVVLAGAGEVPDEEKLKPVKLYPQDFSFMRDSGHEHSEHEWYRQVSELVKEEDQQDRTQTPERDHRSEDHRSEMDRGDFDR